MRANHPFGSGFPNGAINAGAIVFRDPIAQYDGSAQSGRRQRVGCRGLLEDSGGSPPDHGFAVKQHQRHGVAQNGLGREGEFMCEKRPELGRHEASCLAQTFDDDERIGGFAELVDQRLHFGAEKLRRRFSADRAWIDTKKRFADFGVDGNFGVSQSRRQRKQITGREMIALGDFADAVLIFVEHFVGPCPTPLGPITNQLELVGEQPLIGGDQVLIPAYGILAGRHQAIEDRPQALRVGFQIGLVPCVQR